MNLNRIDLLNLNFNEKSTSARNFNTDVSIFSGKMSSINTKTILELLSLGLTEDSIQERLVNYVLENSNDEDLEKIISDQIEQMITEAVEIDEKNTKPTNDNTEETENKINFAELEESPIEEGSENWNLENTGNLFNENISQEDFINEFNILNSLTGENENSSAYLKGIESVGADNFFKTVDTNADGILDETELAALKNVDGDETSISASEFNKVFNETVKNNLEVENPQNELTPENQNIENQEEVTQPTKTENTKKTNRPSNNSSVKTPERNIIEEVETVEDLMKQRNEIIEKVDSQIEALNSEIEGLIEGSNINQELKDNYKKDKENFDTNAKQQKDNEEKIINFDNDIHEINRSISSSESELSSLKTDTNNEEINQKNEKRKSELTSQISKLKIQKQEIEEQKKEVEDANLKLVEDAVTLKQNLDNSYNAMMAEMPAEIKTEIESLKTQITEIEAQKEKDLNAIDAKIEVRKNEELKQSKTEGQMLGLLSSNEFSAKIVETAMKYKGFNEEDGSYKKFSTGDYGWCADFVSYVIKEVGKASGMTDAEYKELKTHTGASPQKISYRYNDDYYYETSKMSDAEYNNFIQNQLQPGMAFIMPGSGSSGQHTGFVVEVYDDGTFLTIEGNSGNMVKQNRRKLSEMYGFVDFSSILSDTTRNF